MKSTTYICGNEAAYTGETRMISGALFYVLTYLEGPQMGSECVTQRAPGGASPCDGRARAEWQQMQAGFGRLAQLTKEGK